MPNSTLNRPKHSQTIKPGFAECSARILAVIRTIPPGYVTSYSDIAARASLPGRARLVARALKLTDEPTLPWQRVIRADGSCAVPGQQALLTEEGVQFQGLRVAASFWLRASIEVTSAEELDQYLWGF